MFPYIDIGPVHLGTFGLLFWLAAVVGTVVLHRNFVRNGVDARCAKCGGVCGYRRGDRREDVA